MKKYKIYFSPHWILRLGFEPLYSHSIAIHRDLYSHCIAARNPSDGGIRPYATFMAGFVLNYRISVGNHRFPFLTSWHDFSSSDTRESQTWSEHLFVSKLLCVGRNGRSYPNFEPCFWMVFWCFGMAWVIHFEPNSCQRCPQNCPYFFGGIRHITLNKPEWSDVFLSLV